MQKLKRLLILIIVSFMLCISPVFAQPPDLEKLQFQFNALIWEMNYCRQRVVVLQSQAEIIQKRIEVLKAQEQIEKKEEKKEKHE